MSTGFFPAQSLLKSSTLQQDPEEAKKLQFQKTEIISRFVQNYIYSDGHSLLPNIQVKLYTDSAKYEGDLNNQGLKQGRGIYHYPNGDKYLGDWFNDQFNGKGVYIFAMGERYEGDLQHGKKHGKGKFMWTDDSSFEGDFF